MPHRASVEASVSLKQHDWLRHLHGLEGGRMRHTSGSARDVSERRAAPARDWRRIGLWLVAASMAYNVAEGVVALWAEAKETLACSYLSCTLPLGLVANALAGWWWADPVAALFMVPWLVKEGIEGLRGEHGECSE